MLILASGTSAWAGPIELTVTGDWQVRASLPASPPRPAVAATLDVPSAVVVEVVAEKHDRLPLFRNNVGGWAKGAGLRGVRAQECTNAGLLDAESLVLRAGPETDAVVLEPGKDYERDLVWGTFGRLPGGRIGENQVVYASYRHALPRIDSVVSTPDGRIVLKCGEPRPAAPTPPTLAPGESRLANLWIPGWTKKLGPDNFFPILDGGDDGHANQPPAEQRTAERLLPKTLQKLRAGQPLRILAWGDSVTDAGYLPDPGERWQVQMVAQLQQRFPQARIELVTEAWGGRSTASYLAEPPGSPHNYQEKVLDARPDLIVSEFVNDAGLNPTQVEERYGRLLADFQRIGAEWIILTPHYVRPDWMGLAREREIDEDPRPYVAGLRQFAARHDVALADASLRWGRLWRQGIPYSTLHLNAINHPNGVGMKLFADSVLALFP